MQQADAKGSPVGTVKRHIAVVRGADGERIQELLAETVADLRAAGTRIAGVLAQSYGSPEGICSAGVLQDIGSSDRFPIRLDTSPPDTTCHLDARGVDAACQAVMSRMADSDLVVLSKFGKLEAMRQGLFPAFEAAVSGGRPVMTTVSAKHRDAWQAFAPDAVYLDADRAALTDWWLRQARA